ncbi:MAG: leucine-rich repeat domain-containing protein [Butyricicoccus sp.]|nr:leucine-rich repeat domain-containing protein [Butyricicoccus sp.]
MKNKKMMYIIGGAGAAVIVLAIVLCLALGSCGDSKYDRYYSQAQTAFLERDYDSALQNLEKAIAAEPTAEAYLLMGEVYRQQGSVDMAIQVLYLGYSKTGDELISRRLEELKSEKNAAAAEAGPDEEFKIAGSAVPLDSTSLLLVDMGLTDSDISSIGRLSSLESLSLSGNKLSSLAPLSALSNLTFLEVSGNSIDDLSPLKNLTKLKNLYIDGNPITDFSPLHSLTSLRTLSMKNIDVTDEQLNALHEALPNCSIYADKDIEAVSEISLGNRTFMSDVKELDLSGDTITDLSPLAKCTALERLEARNCGITDISSLVDLQSLTWLDISENEIEDLRPLMSLSGLTHLDAHENKVKDVTVLLYLTELAELDLSGNPLSGFTSIGRLEKLTELSLRDTGVIDLALESLEGLTNLRKLDLEQNKELSANKVDELGEKLPNCTILADDLLYTVSFGSLTFKSDALNISAISSGADSLDGLEEFKNLTSLVLTDNSISDLDPLKELTKLQTLGLRGNSVSDLTPLSRLTALRSLDLTDNSISDISALSGCTALEELHLGSNSVRDLSALAYCRSLVSLELDGNEITDISALGYLTNLTMLNLDNNSISDLTPLYTLKNLQVLYIHGNNVKLVEIENIRAALPNCTVACDSFGPGLSDEPEAVPVSGGETE